jgi:membrane-associated phospholipid phosphatase
MSFAFVRSLVCVVTLALGAAAQAQVVAGKDRFGDAMRIGLPLAAAALSLAKDDTEGLQQLAMSTVLSAGSTALLKRAVHSRRPDGSAHGFPSGHVAMAFTAAAYVHQRYSLEWALPMYGLATLTAYQRVHTHNHFAKDVVGGAAVGIASALLFTGRFTHGTTASIGYVDKTLLVNYATQW